jgi:hypothetical protein
MGQKGFHLWSQAFDNMHFQRMVSMLKWALKDIKLFAVTGVLLLKSDRLSFSILKPLLERRFQSPTLIFVSQKFSADFRPQVAQVGGVDPIAMVRFRGLTALACLTQLVTVHGADCLSTVDVIPANQRVDITLNGQSIPIGFSGAVVFIFR